MNQALLPPILDNMLVIPRICILWGWSPTNCCYPLINMGEETTKTILIVELKQ